MARLRSRATRNPSCDWRTVHTGTRELPVNAAISSPVGAPEPSSAMTISAGTTRCRATLSSTAASASGRSYVVMTSAIRTCGSGARQAAHRVEAHGERGEIGRADRAHLAERALPAGEHFRTRRAPALDPLAGRAARTQHLLRELAMRAHG